MSKLSFRARALDCARPLCVWLAEELPEPPDASAISRAVPALPSGMEKEEECEHHLQRAICTGLIIPTPEVSDTADLDFYERCYPADYKMPRQLIHMQPLCLEQETPEYDMDSEDERWLRQQRRAELTELKFEEMMDRLERSSGQTVVTLSEAKLLLERQDDLVIAVYDYWLNKRLKTQHPLILSVRTENRVGQSANNPYLAFRRRTEKMQTRKNRKNDESSYEKMLKLRRDLSRAATLLELVARRERAKRELVRLTALLAERRFTHGDYAGQLVDDVHASAPLRSSFQPVALSTGSSGAGFRREGLGYAGSHYAPRPGHGGVDQPRLREKRQYKRRKHRHHGSGSALREGGVYSSSEEEVALPVLVSGAPAAGAAGAGTEPLTPVEATPVPPVDDGPFAFRRKAGVYYQAPTPMLGEDYEAPVSPAGKESRHSKDKRFRFTLTSINHPYPKCIGFARRRLGRGGRVVLDRISTPLDDLWPHLHYRFPDSTSRRPHDDTDTVGEHRRHRYPAETSKDYHSGGKYSWRHAFRQHCANNPTLWTSSDVKREKVELNSAVKLDSGLSDQKHDQSLPDYKYVPSITTALKYDEGLPSDHKYAVSEVTDKCEPMDLDSVLPQDLNKLNGDISCSRRGVEASVRASLARQVRVRGRARRRSSDSSCEGAPLEPREREFAAFVEQVNTEWLHFRPKTPPAEPPRVPEDTDRLPLTADTPIAVELRLGAHDPPSKALLEDSSPFTTSEFTLADLYGDSLLNVDPGESSGSLDASGDDSSLLADHFSGLTDAQVESILSDTDLKALADDDKKNSIDLLKPDDADAILEELVKGEVNGKSEDPFLLSGQSAAGRGTLGASAAYSGHKRRKKAPKFTDFGSSVVTVTPIEDDEAIYVDLIPPPPPELPKTSTPITKILEPAPLPKKPIEKPPVKEELKAEPKRKLAKEEVIEDVQLAQGVQLKTVQTKHSPLKKHIITSAAHRRNTDSMTLVTSQDAAQTQPQIVTVAVSESLKMRLQNHLLANQQQGLVTIDGSSLQTSGATVVGLVQNGPFTVSSAGGVAMAVPASVSMATVSREGTVSVAGIASTSSPRRVSTPLVHLTPAALHQKQLQQISHQPPVVVAHPHTLQHNKLKVLHAHTLTQSQRTQLLAQSRAAGITQLPAVVSLSTLGETKSTPTTALQLKAAPGSVAQFFEIKSGQLGKGPHLVNVVRQPQPGKTTVARLDLNDAKKRTQVVATFDGTLKGNIARATTPHRLSVSLDGRHLVRAALPTVRAHPVRHPIQLKNRTLVATSQQQASTSITIAAPSKTTSLPNSVVANLLQKNAMAKGGQKIAIAGGTQGLANVQAFTAFTHAQQLKARQARLVAQPRPNQTADIVDATPTTSGAAPTGDTTDPSDGTNGSVRRRPAETLPMEVT